MKTKIAIILLVITGAFASCKKEYDQPPVKEIPEGSIITIQELKDTFSGNVIKFDHDFNLFAVVTMDEKTGNIYKNVYIQDETGGINLRMLSGGGLYEGDSIRINLKGINLNQFNGNYQLDSVDVDKSVVKQATKVNIEPQNITISQVDSDLQATLVRLNNVEFVGDDLNSTYADATNQQSKNLTLTDCVNNTLLVRTSGFADFAGDTIPSGNGSIVGVISEFNGEFQLYIRGLDEVEMTGERCTAGGGGGGGGGGSSYLFKNFDDNNLTSGGWMNYTVTGNGFEWTTSDQGSQGNYYGKATGWDGSNNNETELWLISPAVDLSGASAPGLSFRNAYNFTGPDLQLMISTDYDGSSDPSIQGTWQDYTSNATWSSGSFAWSDSGVIPMTAFNGSNSVYIAFKFTSTNSNSATWEVDDIIIEEQ